MAKLSEGRQRLLLMVTILLEGLQEQVLIRSMTRRCAKTSDIDQPLNPYRRSVIIQRGTTRIRDSFALCVNTSGS